MPNPPLLAARGIRIAKLHWLATLSLICCFPGVAQGQALVIAQVFGGGGNTGAPFQNDYVVVFNRGESPISLGGKSIQYASATGTVWQVTELPDTSLEAGQYFLIQESGGVNGIALPTPDAVGDINMSSTNGKVSVVNSTTPLSGSCPSESVLDMVGYGTADCFEGAAAVAALDNTSAALRSANGCLDTDDNLNDFTVDNPDPLNSASNPNPCPTDKVFLNGFESRFEIIALEPPIILQSVGVGATAHVNELVASPFSVTLSKSGESPVNPPFLFDPAHPGLLDIDIPPGLATGIWDLSVEHSSQSTTDSLSAAFMVVDTLSLDLGVQPAALPDVEGGVIRLSSKSQFAAVPQVLLVSSSARGGSMGMRLRGVHFNGPDDVIAPVPPGLFAGDYDVIVINPDGGAGVAAAALAVSSDQAPSVGEVFPSSFSINDATSLTISGSGFQAGIFAQLVCEDGLTQALTVDDVSGTSVDVTYFPGGLSQGVCTMDLQNPDGQVTSFAAIRLNPPAGGIGASEAASAMNLARRAPSLALHRAGSDHFTLYAMGGDDGMSANVLDSVEIGSVDRYGDIGSWYFSRNSLPAGRSFAWAGQLGEFLYLVGGSDGSTATDSIYRAQVLDPADAPMVTRHTMMYSPGAPGFSGGQQVYRVSAVFPGSDPINPDGESLSGRSRNVFVPNAAEVALNLEWDAVPGATAYRIYTHPVGVTFDGDINNLELVATTSSTSWMHTGQITDPAELPLREGETGAWHLVSGWAPGTPRSHFAGALAPLPGAAGSSVFYVIGGLDEKDATLGSYEYAIVSSADTLAPNYGSFSVGSDTLATAVSELVAMVVTAEGTDDSWIFMGTGLDSIGVDQRDLERGAVSMTGDLGTLVAGGSSPTQDRAGSSGLAGLSSLGLAGGLNGLSSTSVQLSNFDDSGSGPEMDNWNAAFGLIEARIYAGTAHGSVFIFVAGGEDDKEITLSSVERMLR